MKKKSFHTETKLNRQLSRTARVFSKSPVREFLATWLLLAVLFVPAAQGPDSLEQREPAFGSIHELACDTDCNEIDGSIIHLLSGCFLTGSIGKHPTGSALRLREFNEFAANETRCASHVVDDGVFGLNVDAAVLEDQVVVLLNYINIMCRHITSLAPAKQQAEHTSGQSSGGTVCGTSVPTPVNTGINASPICCALEGSRQGFAAAFSTAIAVAGTDKEIGILVFLCWVFFEPCIKNGLALDQRDVDDPRASLESLLCGIESNPSDPVPLYQVGELNASQLARTTAAVNRDSNQCPITSTDACVENATELIVAKVFGSGILHPGFALLEWQVNHLGWGLFGLQCPLQVAHDLNMPLIPGALAEWPCLELAWILGIVNSASVPVIGDEENDVLSRGVDESFFPAMLCERDQRVESCFECPSAIDVAFFDNEVRQGNAVFFVLNLRESAELFFEYVGAECAFVAAFLDGCHVQLDCLNGMISRLDCLGADWAPCDSGGSYAIRNYQVAFGSISKLEEILPETIITLRISPNKPKQKRRVEFNLDAVPEAMRARVNKLQKIRPSDLNKFIDTLPEEQREALKKSGFQIEIPFNANRKRINSLLKEQRQESEGKPIIVIYIRVSTPEQARHPSLVANLANQLAKAAGLDLIVGGIVVEVGQGDDPERPGLREMMDFVQNHFVFGVMVPCVDRFYRDEKFGLQEVFRLDDSGAVLIYGDGYEDESCEMAIWEHESSRSNLCSDLKTAELEKKKTKDRIAMAIRSRLKQGELVFRNSLTSMLYEATSELDENDVLRAYVDARENQLEVLRSFNKKLKKFVQNPTDEARSKFLDWCSSLIGQTVTLDSLFYEFDMGWGEGENRSKPNCHLKYVVECPRLKITGGQAAYAAAKKLLGKLERPKARKIGSKIVGWTGSLIEALLFNELEEATGGDLRLALVCVRCNEPTIVEFREPANYKGHGQVLFLCPGCTKVDGKETRRTFLTLKMSRMIDARVGTQCWKCDQFTFNELETDLALHGERIVTFGCSQCDSKHGVYRGVGQRVQRRQKQGNSLTSGQIARARFDLMMKAGLGVAVENSVAREKILGNAPWSEVKGAWNNSLKALGAIVEKHNKSNPGTQLALMTDGAPGRPNPSFWLVQA